MTSPTPDVFISYARSDARTIAERLFDELGANDIEAYFDRRSLDPFQDYTTTIENAIEQATHVAVCVTADSKRSDSFVRREIQYALNVPRPIVPLRFAPVAPQIHIATISFIDFFDGWDAGFMELLDRLRKPVGERDYGQRPEDPFDAHLEQLSHYVVEELRRTVLDANEIVDLLAAGAGGGPGAQPGRTESGSQRTLPAAYRSRRPALTSAADVPSEREEVRKGPSHDEQQFASFAAAFAHQDRRAILLGEPGGGKTTTLLVAAREAAARRLDDLSAPVPAYVPIRTWNGSQELVDWMAEATGVEPRLLRKALEERQAILILDGLDEVRQVSLGGGGGEDPRLRFLRAIGELDPSAWVVSCRGTDYRDLIESSSAPPVAAGLIQLLPLTDEQISRYLEDDADLLAAVQSDEALRQMARNPLMLTLLALAYRDEAEQALPLRDLHSSPADLRSRVFRKYVARRYEFEQARHDEDYRPRFTLDDLYRGLGVVALDLLDRFQRVEIEISDNGYSMTRRADVGPVSYVEFNTGSVRRRLGRDAFAMLDLARRLNLVVPVGPRSMRFAHLLLRDHFALRHCVEVLDGTDLQDRRAAAGALGLIADPRAVPRLVQALDDEDDTVQVLAIWSLGEIGDPTAVQPLLDRIRRSEDYTRAGLRVSFGFEALAKMGPPGVEVLEEVVRGAGETVVGPTVAKQGARNLVAEAVSALCQASPAAAAVLIDAARADRGLLRDFNVRRTLLDALAEIGGPEVVDLLIDALDDFAGGDAAWALSRTRDERALPALLRDRSLPVWGRWEAVAAIGGPQASAGLASALRDGDPEARSAVARALGRVGDQDAVTALRGALADRDLRVRAAAVEALEQVGYDPDALAAARPSTRELMTALQGSDDGIRAAAAGLLASRREPGVAEGLLAAAAESSGWARQTALVALAAHGDARAVEPLGELLFTGESFNPGDANETVATALGQIGTADAARHLLVALDQDDWRRETILKALESIGAPAAEPLVAALRDADPSFRGPLASAIVRLGGAAAAGLCTLLVTEAGRTAVEALGEIGRPAVPALIGVVRDPSAIVRARAAEALGLIADELAADLLIELLGDRSRAVRSSARWALEELDGRSVVKLIACLRDPSARGRVHAVEALGSIGDGRALRPLLAALRDPDPMVRGSAIWALVVMSEIELEPELRAMLDDSDAVVRLDAVDGLVRLGVDATDLAAHRPSQDEMAAAMSSPDPERRCLVAALLAEGPDWEAGVPERFTAALVSALSDDDEDVRYAAAIALAALHRFAELATGLRSADERVRTACQQGLSDAPEVALAPVREVLADSQPPARAGAAAVLGAWHDEPSVDHLIALLVDEAIQDEISSALAQMPEVSGPRLEKLLIDDRLGPIVAVTISRMGESAVSAMVALLGDIDRRYRACAARVLSEIGRPAVQPLIDAVRGNDVKVQMQAAEVLGRIGHPRGLAVLATVLDGNAFGSDAEEDSAVREAAAAALGRPPQPLITASEPADDSAPPRPSRWSAVKRALGRG